MGPVVFIRKNLRYLAVGFLLMMTSSFGQTFFISIFALEIMREFELDDRAWGGLYTLATLASAFVMLWAGALTDRFRVRTLSPIVLIGLSLTCANMVVSGSVWALFFVIFFLRLLGQGMTFQIAAVAMARWFAGRRGLALSLAGLGFWVGQAALPPLVAWLLEWTEWRSIWFISALTIVFVTPLIYWLVRQERTPQSFAEVDESVGMDCRHWTRGEVLRSPLFWSLIPILLGPPAWGTALFFQQMHIAEIKGWSPPQYLSLIPLMTVVSVLVNLLTGQLIDRFGSGHLFRVFPLTWIAGFLLLSEAETLFDAAMAFLAFGIATGVQATLITAFWAEYFGTRHIGAIKAVSASIMVLGSAIGPGVSGAMITAGYPFPEQMHWIAAYFAVALVGVVVGVGHASPRLPSTRQIHVESPGAAVPPVRGRNL